jgi:hypothetical protein
LPHDRGNDRALTRLNNQEPFTRELVKRFAYRPPAHSDHLSDASFADLLTRFKFAGNDPLCHLASYKLCERRMPHGGNVADMRLAKRPGAFRPLDGPVALAREAVAGVTGVLYCRVSLLDRRPVIRLATSVATAESMGTSRVVVGHVTVAKILLHVWLSALRRITESASATPLEDPCVARALNDPLCSLRQKLVRTREFL